jgi:hypothetical protein
MQAGQVRDAADLDRLDAAPLTHPGQAIVQAEDHVGGGGLYMPGSRGSASRVRTTVPPSTPRAALRRYRRARSATR